LTFREIAAHLGISLPTVQKYVKRLNLSKRETIIEIDKERLVELWQKGHSCSKIGREFGLCGTTISRIACKMELKKRELKSQLKKYRILLYQILSLLLSYLYRQKDRKQNAIN